MSKMPAIKHRDRKKLLEQIATATGDVKIKLEAHAAQLEAARLAHHQKMEASRGLVIGTRNNATSL